MKRAISVFALSGLLTSCQTVPYTGRSHLVLVSADQERALGEQAYEDALRKAPRSGNREKIALVKRVGERLAQAARRPDFAWEFNLIEDDKTVNAWCLPGGKVAVYTGLLPVAQSEAGLAVVMGHEIAHALARHGAERMSQGLLAEFGGQALSLALSRKPAQTQRLYQQAYGLGMGLGVLLPYSRAQESEADHIGLILMAKAGYDPREALAFWERMKAASVSSKGGPLERYLSTHPTHQDRIEQIRRWLPEVENSVKR